MIRFSSLRLAAASLLLLGGCARDTQWSADELENVQHLLNAQQADVIAERMMTRVSPHGGATDSDRQAVLEHRREALRQAALVRDEVLEKALPGLSRTFRDTFQRGLEQMIAGLESGDAELEAEGARLHQQWIDWSHEHGAEIRIPEVKDVVSA